MYGFWKNKRIVLFDTLIEQCSQEEVVAVLAHELGAYLPPFFCIHLACELPASTSACRTGQDRTGQGYWPSMAHVQISIATSAFSSAFTSALPPPKAHAQREQDQGCCAVLAYDLDAWLHPISSLMGASASAYVTFHQYVHIRSTVVPAQQKGVLGDAGQWIPCLSPCSLPSCTCCIPLHKQH